MSDKGITITVSGTPQVGKTTVSAIILKALHEAGLTGIQVKNNDGDLQKVYGKITSGEADHLDRISGDIVLIDGEDSVWRAAEPMDLDVPSEDLDIQVDFEAIRKGTVQAPPEWKSSHDNDVERYLKVDYLLENHEVEIGESGLNVVVANTQNGAMANQRYDVVIPEPYRNQWVGKEMPWAAGNNILSILFQDGPPPVNGVNGVTLEVLLAICADRLRGFQSGPFACELNQKALDSINMALEALHARTKDRLAREVKNTDKP